MRFLATALLLTATIAQADDRPLRFSVVDSWAMPLARIENGELTGGIMFELFNEAARELGRPATFHIVPRARIEQALLSHSVDVRCHVSHTWVEHEFNDYRWSAPLMEQRDLLVLKKLRIGRYRYAISSEFALNWFNRALPEAERLLIASVIEETPLSCMVLDRPEVRAEEVLSVPAEIKVSGKIEQILDHYR